MLNQEMYGGQVVMTFNPRKHLYSANGIIVPSVTKVTGVLDKPALIYWAVNETIAYIADSWQAGLEYNQAQIDSIVADAKGARFRVSQKALNIGSDAHDWLERYIKSQVLNTKMPELPEYPPVLNAVTSYLEWEKAQDDIEYISSERRLYSMKYKYSGTADIMLRVNGELTLGDLKTSKGIYPEYFLQCAAYAQAWQEEDGVKVDKMSIIRIPKDGSSVEVADNYDVDTLFGVFKACLAVWRWKSGWNPESEKWKS